MGVGMVNRTIIRTFCLSEHLDFGAGQKHSDNQGWTVVQSHKYQDGL